MSEVPENEIRQQAVKDGVTHFASGVAVVRNGKILIVRRAADDYLGGVWELPGGGIDEGETFADSIARELLEETGLKVTTIISMFKGFDYTTPKKPRARQINVLVTVDDGGVKLDPAEHDKYRWITAEDIDTMPTTTDKMRVCLRDAFVTLHVKETQA